MSTVYDASGNSLGTSVAIPGQDDAVGAPTGVVANTTTDFHLINGLKAAFLFAGEDGAITAWDSGGVATIIVSNPDAVYKGLAIATDSSRSFLYAADFKGGKIDVYDGAFLKDSTRMFRDSTLPQGYAPFNIALVGTELYVAYAKQDADGEDDVSGAGNGFVDVFSTGGTLVRRLASSGNLNSPWGIAYVPGTFGGFGNAVFVGNFGDGLINAFDTQGNFLGQVQDSAGTPIKIDGLWALFPANGNLYFTAGPNDETHGIFGYLAPQ
jgi:uncharacterized protein (TIGR03118 family)